MPTATHPSGDKVTWSISGKPKDAGFSASTGAITWTPTSATGLTSTIVLTATDSRGRSASLPGFSINVVLPGQTVTAPTSGSRSTRISWDAPTQFANGTRMSATDLAGYRIYRGATSSGLSRVAEVDPGTLSVMLHDLAAGTHYFAVTAISKAGLESALSPVASKVLR